MTNFVELHINSVPICINFDKIIYFSAVYVGNKIATKIILQDTNFAVDESYSVVKEMIANG